MNRTWQRLRTLHRPYFALFGFQALESLSEWTTYALLLMFILGGGLSSDLPDSVAALLILLASAIPRLAIAPFAARLADALPWRPVLAGACGVRLVALVGLLALLATPLSTTAFLVCAIVVVVGQAATGLVMESARNAATQHEIPEDVRPEAASLSMFALTGIGVASSAVAALVYDPEPLWVGIAVCAVVTAAGLAVLLIAYPQPQDQPRQLTDESADRLTHALRTLRGIPDLRAVTISVVGYGLCLGAVNYAMNLLIFNSLRATPSQYAIITAAFAIGGLVGALVTSPACRMFGELPTYAGAAAGLAATYIGIGASGNWAVATVCMTLCGVFFTAFATVQGPILQRCVPPGQMGSVTASLGPIRSVAMLVGLLVAAGMAFATRGSVTVDAARVSYFLAAGVLVVVAVLVFRIARAARPA